MKARIPVYRTVKQRRAVRDEILCEYRKIEGEKRREMVEGV